jgi:hypothetical protein
MASPHPRDAEALLCEIARCPEVATAIADHTHPCAEVVRFQDRIPVEFQPPTPWVGKLDEAPILFIGSNPNISGREHYPGVDASDAELVDFFDLAFEGERAQIQQGTRPLQADGRYAGSVQTWAGVRRRAEELLERRAIPGRDYAMTEIVHCRSHDETGVDRARNLCADRFLERTLAVSNARIVVGLGAHVRHWLRNRWKLEPTPVSSVAIRNGEQAGGLLAPFGQLRTEALRFGDARGVTAPSSRPTGA